ncbi:hypothetical protein Xmau_01179 [Xenorhabdus mauleonii]|uniref:Pimeloyl-ACP methyl ester carboxylesterase n=1 Tax=Xenorhabdus mauleonii TaxID=351675 RepID=A0A1I3K9B8_9GAMM|nr:alpha/beta hydrolase [Xenorhabdus mauleonii]PHM44974.1 hypothetical protein Xmau_01179 [Xenorhabdus mauleonii]SFI68805.1 Pimeloyl-ACP methyl ester carboxylesterase [Xenorhabdus mauleonii]
MTQYDDAGCLRPETVIFSPIMPLWDQGNFCTPLTLLLEKNGYRVTIIDTLSLINHANPDLIDSDFFIKTVEQELNQRFYRPYLLIGFAMAGTAVQLLAPRLKMLTGVISISGPGYIDMPLFGKLTQLMTLLKENQLDEAISLLHDFVIPEGGTPFPPASTIPNHFRDIAQTRLIIGFSLLLKFDARTVLHNYKGKFLSIVGRSSQLATVCNQVVSSNLEHCFAVIDKAGMRPWDDQPKFINDVINDWLKTL